MEKNQTNNQRNEYLETSMDIQKYKNCFLKVSLCNIWNYIIQNFITKKYFLPPDFYTISKLFNTFAFANHDNEKYLQLDLIKQQPGETQYIIQTFTWIYYNSELISIIFNVDLTNTFSQTETIDTKSFDRPEFLSASFKSIFL